ncbi:MAG: type II toxin-antitoxin system HicA family toxin [Phycisphaeraceae bacterium]
MIAALQRAGFAGPNASGKHPIMRRGGVTIHVPNPHQGDVSRDLLSRILRQAGISKSEWERL